MDDDDRPPAPGIAGAPGARAGDAAGLLATESLERYSQDELAARIALLEREIARVKARHSQAAAHRAAAEAFFRPKD